METNGCQVLLFWSYFLKSETYNINGKIRRCHQDQVHKRLVKVPQDSHYELDILDIDIPSSSPETVY